MKTIKRLSIVSSLCVLSLLTACERQVKSDDITGRWQLVSVTSQIGDCEPEVYYEPTAYTFNADSTVTIQAEEETDSGTWTLCPDSTLIVALASMEDESVEADTTKVILCNGEELVLQTLIDTDFGLITETYNLTKDNE